MPEELDADQDAQSYAEIAVEIFRLEQAIHTALDGLDASEAKRLERRARFSLERIERVLLDKGIRVIAVEEGTPYDAGIPAQPLNIDEFDLESDSPVVDQVLEPTVVGTHGLLRAGTVMLRGK